MWMKNTPILSRYTGGLIGSYSGLWSPLKQYTLNRRPNQQVTLNGPFTLCFGTRSDHFDSCRYLARLHECVHAQWNRSNCQITQCAQLLLGVKKPLVLLVGGWPLGGYPIRCRFPWGTSLDRSELPIECRKTAWHTAQEETQMCVLCLS